MHISEEKKRALKNLKQVRGIGDSTAGTLYEVYGITTVKELWTRLQRGEYITGGHMCVKSDDLLELVETYYEEQRKQ